MKRDTLRAFFLASLLLVPATSTLANGIFGSRPENPIFIVPRTTTPFHIPVAMLTGDPAVSLHDLQPASRGQLSMTETQLTYVPDAAFRIKGSDSFTFRYEAGEELITGIAFLVADLRRSPDDAALNGETTAGGNTVLMIDIGQRCLPFPCPPPPETTTTTIARGIDEFNRTVFELELIDLVDGTSQLTARAFTHGLAIETHPIALAIGSHEIELGWWLSSARARNGGMTLKIDGTLADFRVGLDNHVAEGGGLYWHLEPLASNAPHPRPWIMTYGRDEDLPPPFPPLFADNFETDGRLRWTVPIGGGSATVGPDGGPLITSSATVDGQSGLRLSLADPAPGRYLIDTSPNRAKRYRARFELSLDPACGLQLAPQEKPIVLLEGFEGDSAAPLFQLSIHPGSDGSFRAVVRGWQDNGVEVSSTPSAPLGQNTTLDLEWWTSNGKEAADGGLALRIDRPFAPDRELILHNDFQRLDGVRFGAVEAHATAWGHLCVDEFESWQ